MNNSGKNVFIWVIIAIVLVLVFNFEPRFLYKLSKSSRLSKSSELLDVSEILDSSINEFEETIEVKESVYSVDDVADDTIEETSTIDEFEDTDDLLEDLDDSVLIDDARTPLIISGPTPTGDKHEFGELKHKISSLVDVQKKFINTIFNNLYFCLLI